MKKIIISLVVAVVAIFTVSFAIMSIDFNRLNKDTYYVQITADGLLEKTKLDNGEIMKRYEYKMDAVNENGDKKELEFSANKNLRKDAYLKIYVKKDTATVTSYDEVAEKELPKKVKSSLK